MHGMYELVFKTGSKGSSKQREYTTCWEASRSGRVISALVMRASTASLSVHSDDLRGLGVVGEQALGIVGRVSRRVELWVVAR